MQLLPHGMPQFTGPLNVTNLASLIHEIYLLLSKMHASYQSVLVICASFYEA